MRREGRVELRRAGGVGSVLASSGPWPGPAAAAAGGGGSHHGRRASTGTGCALGHPAREDALLRQACANPNDTRCAGAAVYTSTVEVHGDGSYDSGSFRPTAPGNYTFRLRYDGDANNIGVGPTNWGSDHNSAESNS